jgi:hypothetical protein
MGSRNGFLYNILRSLISNAIQEVLLFETQLKSEKALTNYAAELARTNTELIRSNKELELFAYAASHDLQEPLRMIKSYLQLIQRRYQHKLDKNADEFIWFAMDGANRMEMMIGDLLAYSRITTQVKPFERCDCKEILLEVLTNLQVSIKESEAIVTYDNLPVLVGDRNQLWRVFQNLIANAIKFRSDKPPHVHVGVQKKEKEWEFAVRDNGIGIPQEAYERIFMIFQRLHTHKEYKGMGIGLALCKKIIEHHNGRIWVYSVIGSGSSFFFTLPDRF